MYSIGYDIGSSSIKAALIETASGAVLGSLSEPDNEMEINAVQQNWAEQDPDVWWAYVCKATKKLIEQTKINASKISAIGISYQMHGLVLVDNEGEPLRDAIIWCDSRAIEIGNLAFKELGEQKCMDHLLNAPGNFTASKLKWVKENEPLLFNKADKFMLPGDYIAYKLSGSINTTKNGLSEGILYDYKNEMVADWVLDYFGIPLDLVPDIVANFTDQSFINDAASNETGLPMGIPIRYRAGDQPNNALALNIMKPGEVAATGGTSGVLYAVTDQKTSEEPSRINHFAHVNYSERQPYIGKLLCINGAGIQYRWLLNNGSDDSYEVMNTKAEKVPVGSDGVLVLPFGNGAERMFDNKTIGTQICNLNLNLHNDAHLYRAALEGIAFSFVYGMEILKKDHAGIHVIRAGNDNLFRSELFSTTIATLTGHDIEIYNTTGAIGAARAATITDGDFDKLATTILAQGLVKTFTPKNDKAAYIEAYTNWKKELAFQLKK